jgi:uncharacterized protein YjlB
VNRGLGAEAEAEVAEIRVAPDHGVPNHPELPALLYARAFAADAGVEGIAGRFRANGWSGVWHWSVYGFHHFHPASHEALGVARGEAVLQLGGPDGPERRVRAGDVVILPAGFGHRRLSDAGGFTVVGAYPPGQEGPEIMRAGAEADAEAAARARASIAATPLPATDPVFGRGGPLLRRWAPLGTAAR